MPKAATVQNAGMSLLALMLSGAVAFTAEPTGPRTLEKTLANLLAAADTEPQAAVAANEAPKDAEEPPAAAKNDPLQQRLDSALAEYNPAIERAIDELAKEIEEEFDEATKKGDIQLARKCKEAEAALRERGTPPDNDFLKHAREDTYRKITRAGAKLAAEFEVVAKECLKAGDLDRAEAVLSEKADLLAEMKAWQGRRVQRPQKSPLPPVIGDDAIFLSDLEEQITNVDGRLDGKNGDLGYENSQITVAGVKSDKGLSMHPPNNGKRSVLYAVPRGYRRLIAVAAINDTESRDPIGQKSALTFKVVGDNAVLWTSRPLRGAGQSQSCDVPLNGCSNLRLVVECPGTHECAHAVWVDPVLLSK